MVVKIDKSHAAQEGYENIMYGLQWPAGQRAIAPRSFQAIRTSHRADGPNRQLVKSLSPANSAMGSDIITK